MRGKAGNDSRGDRQIPLTKHDFWAGYDIGVLTALIAVSFCHFNIAGDDPDRNITFYRGLLFQYETCRAARCSI